MEKVEGEGWVKGVWRWGSGDGNLRNENISGDGAIYNGGDLFLFSFE